MALSLFSKKEEVSLIIDIGSGSISGAFVLFVEGKNPKLIYSIRLPFSVGAKVDSEKLLSSMVSLLDNLLKNILSNGMKDPFWKNRKKNIDSVVISLSSPWFASKIKNIHLDQKMPFIVTEKFLADILKKEELIFQNELKDETYEKTFDPDIKMIENMVVSSKINGYTVSQIIGQKTKIFDISLYISFVSKSILDSIHKQIVKHTNVSDRQIHIHTFPLVSFTVMREFFPKTEDFLLMDVTSEITDITSVHSDSIVESASFPSGRNFIIRQIAKSLDVSSEVAESFLHLFNLGKSDEMTSERIKNILVDVEREWAIYFEDVLTEFSKNKAVPVMVYMTAEADVVSIYKDFMKMPKMDATSTFRKNVTIIHINEELLKNFYDYNGKSEQDEFLGMISIFYGKVRK